MSSLPLSRDAATVLGLAGTALPFARSADEEVERWLRPLRLYGGASIVLQRLAIGEAPLTDPVVQPPETARPAVELTLTDVAARAARSAADRGEPVVGTVDVLVAVMDHYPDAFERALNGRGSDRAEVLDRLASTLASERFS
jgi:hypothetical protein